MMILYVERDGESVKLRMDRGPVPIGLSPRLIMARLGKSRKAAFKCSISSLNVPSGPSLGQVFEVGECIERE